MSNLNYLKKTLNEVNGRIEKLQYLIEARKIKLENKNLHPMQITIIKRGIIDRTHELNLQIEYKKMIKEHIDQEEEKNADCIF